MSETNDKQTESLLSRFAAVSQRLKGTGAPGMPEWVSRFDLSNIESMPKGSITGGINGINDDGTVDLEEHCYNPQACLAGCVVWAMEVADYVALNHPSGIHGGVSRYRKGEWMWRIDWVDLPDCEREGKDASGVVKSIPEAWCCMLESIADAIGGG